MSEASGFEDAHAIARTVTLRGTPAANALEATGCRQTIAGRAGPDDEKRVECERR